MHCGTPDFGFNYVWYGCVHGDRSRCQEELCRCLYSRATSLFYDMHVNRNVRSHSSHLGHFSTKATGANHLSLKAVSFCCPSRTYSYEVNLSFSLAKIHSASTDIAVITSLEQCKLVLSESSSALFLKPSISLLAASYQRLSPLKSRAIPIPTPQTSPEPAGPAGFTTPKWRRTYSLSHFCPNEALPRVQLCTYVCRTVKVPALGQYLCKLVKTKTPLI